MPRWPRVIVVGGSIGGLTAAVLLRELGCDVHVCERSSEELQHRGVGIVVLPMTERYFMERGGDDDRVSLELTFWSYVNHEGTLLSVDPDHYRFSSWTTVYRALLDAFDPARYHLQSEMVALEQHPTGAAVVLRDGERVGGDLVVCADGVASTARSILLPGVEPVYAGYVAWRGTTPERVLSPPAQADLADSMLYQVLPVGHILVYAIPDADGSVTPGTRLVNFVWYRNYPEGGPVESVMTDVRGEPRGATVPPGMVRPDYVAEMHRSTDVLAPTLREVVLKAAEPFIQAIFDLESPRMAFGRVCILGDAAFVARPHVAAGTAKACADAWALRDALRATDGDVDAALTSWEPQQLELGRTVVDRSRRMGQRSQFEGTMIPGDSSWKFGLFEPGN
jgi:2,6-dihydroxypyridine 3-monooxygenase